MQGAPKAPLAGSAKRCLAARSAARPVPSRPVPAARPKYGRRRHLQSRIAHHLVGCSPTRENWMLTGFVGLQVFCLFPVSAQAQGSLLVGLPRGSLSGMIPLGARLCFVLSPPRCAESPAFGS